MNKLLLIALLIFSLNSFSKSSMTSKGAGGAVYVINEFQADPAGDISGDANGDGSRNGTQDEFVEIANTSGVDGNISNWTLSDAVQVRHTFPDPTIIPAGCSIVVFGGGTPTGNFGFSLVQTASTGGLGLNNSGDTITLSQGGSPIVSQTYGTEGGDNQSVTRDPDLTGSFVKHSTATTSGGSLYSPGTLANGSAFSGCPVGDLPPTITSTTPTNQESGVATSATITINFSETIDAVAPAFTLNCDSGPQGFSTSGLTNTDTITITPSLDLPDGELCTVTSLASQITDANEGGLQLDGNGDSVPGDDHSFAFLVGTPNLEIWQIQGSGTASSYDGYTVSSNDNIITALDTNGFFMQTPQARSDGDPNTSDGIFVYTGTPLPAVAVVGNQVDVSGPVIEFFEFTEFTTPVTVTADLNPASMPPAVVLNDSFPPNDPTIPVCSTDQETHKYECLEGMHFDMPQGFISSGFAGNPAFPGANAEDVLLRAGSSRAFREPGIDHPGDPGLSTLVFDGNPEILEMDFDGLTINLGSIDYTQLAGGTEISAKGVFGFDFGEYEIWPYELNIVNSNTIPGAVRDTNSSEYTVGSFNLFRLFDDIDDPHPSDDESVTTAEYNDKLAKLSKYIVNDLKTPMILAVQEVEKIDALTALASQISTESGGTVSYTAHLIEGPDPGGIDVGFLLLDNVTPSMGFPIQLGTSETYIDPRDGSVDTLHDRPPLHLQADVTLPGETIRVHVLVVHNRSRGSIESSDPLNAQRVRLKRFTQANSVADMIDDIQSTNPGEPIVTLGDFNAFQFSDGYADVIGQITGTAVDEENEFWSLPLFAANPLTQAIQTLPTSQQYSYIFNGSAQALDNAILNDAALQRLNDIEFARGQADANISFADDNTSSLRVSDHDGFVLFMTEDFDLIFENGFE